MRIENLGKFHIRQILKLLVMLTGVIEEICQVHFVFSLDIFLESYGFYKCFVELCCFANCEMNTAQVNKIECRASHNKHSLEVVTAVYLSKVKNFSAAVCRFISSKTRRRRTGSPSRC